MSGMGAAMRSKILRRSKLDPVWWVETILGDELWDDEKKLLEALRDDDEVAWKSCHSGGKSWTAARGALWFLYNFYRSIVITTAPTDRQVRGILWSEIRQAHANARYPLGGRMLSQQLFVDEDVGWFAMGFTAPDYDPNRFQGWHAPGGVLAVMDEASGISKNIHDGVDALMTGANTKKLLIGNPTDPASEFAKAFKDEDVTKITTSAFDTPNFTAFGITPDDIAKGTWREKIKGDLPAPHLVTPEWVARRYRRWGPTSPLYEGRVLATFPEQGTDTLIPLAWIEAAQQRELEPGLPVTLGLDVAEMGADRSVCYVRRGCVLRRVFATEKQKTTATVGNAVRAIRETGASEIIVDRIGVGRGPYDTLDEMSQEPGGLDVYVNGLSVAVGARDKEQYANKRAELFWGLRERFEAGDIDLDPEDEELAADLSNIKYKPNSRGQIQIELKELARKRIGRSPDYGDAAAMAFADEGMVDFREEGVELGSPLAAAGEGTPWDDDAAMAQFGG